MHATGRAPFGKEKLDGALLFRILLELSGNE